MTINSKYLAPLSALLLPAIVVVFTLGSINVFAEPPNPAKMAQTQQAPSQLAAISYLGDLDNTTLTPFAGFQGNALEGDNTGNPDAWDYWRFCAVAGDTVTINTHRTSDAMDPAQQICQGTAGGTFGITAFQSCGPDMGYITSADDNNGIPHGVGGAFSDPQSIFVAPTTGEYTLAVWDFLGSGPGPTVPYEIHLAGVTPCPSLARFIIQKEWDQDGATDGLQVTAHLSCTGANVTQQNVVFTATTDAILFVYDIDLAIGQVDCTITEDVPDGYTASYNCNGSDCGDSGQSLDECFYPDVASNAVRTCTITNTPDPASITVTKTWVVEGADSGFDGDYSIQVNCDSQVTGPGGEYSSGSSNWWAYVYGNASTSPDDFEFTVVRPSYPETSCYVYESNDDSVVETDNGCNGIDVSAGDDVSCDIVNTVFFEGIPTLNQYGMAILALLMLGVGFVGFRRFV